MCNFCLIFYGIIILERTNNPRSNWKWPDIDGLHDFKGDLIHSARWPAEFGYKDKTVAVIGNGSSGVQIVPAIHSQVKKLVHVVRTPTWIIPPRVQIFSMGPAADVLREVEIDDDENFTPEQIQRFQADPALYRTFVKTIEKEVNNAFPIVCLLFPSILFPVFVRTTKTC